jgi:hypothetical protein
MNAAILLPLVLVSIVISGKEWTTNGQDGHGSAEALTSVEVSLSRKEILLSIYISIIMGVAGAISVGVDEKMKIRMIETAQVINNITALKRSIELLEKEFEDARSKFNNKDEIY